MYDQGEGVPQDYKLAVEWYRIAAEQGEARAQSNLGYMYDQGKGVPQDYKLAVEWYRKAAEQGNAQAQFNLGYMYAGGKGVPQDYKLAVEWHRKAAEQGNAIAQFNLGVMYAGGKGVPQDYKLAVDWYRKAAEQGNAQAQFNLGYMYDQGKGVPQDYKLAVEWYRKAAEQGYASAQLNLGCMYGNGKGVPQNDLNAYAWFNLAAAQGDKQAVKNRDLVASKITPEQRSQAQNLAGEIQAKIDNPTLQTAKAPPSAPTATANEPQVKPSEEETPKQQVASLDKVPLPPEPAPVSVQTQERPLAGNQAGGGYRENSMEPSEIILIVIVIASILMIGFAIFALFAFVLWKIANPTKAKSQTQDDNNRQQEEASSFKESTQTNSDRSVSGTTNKGGQMKKNLLQYLPLFFFVSLISLGVLAVMLASKYMEGRGLDVQPVVQAAGQSEQSPVGIVIALILMIGFAIFAFSLWKRANPTTAKSKTQEDSKSQQEKASLFKESTQTNYDRPNVPQEVAPFLPPLDAPTETVDATISREMLSVQQDPFFIKCKTFGDEPTCILIDCGGCGKPFSKRTDSCPKCGWRQAIPCQVCQQKIPHDSSSCPECGDTEPFKAQNDNKNYREQAAPLYESTPTNYDRPNVPPQTASLPDIPKSNFLSLGKWMLILISILVFISQLLGLTENPIDGVINILSWLTLYMSAPIIIRYVIMRRPIENKWIVIGMLVPIFIGCALLNNIHKEEGQKRLYQQLGIPHKSTKHIFGSPILDMAMITSYYILYRKRKETEVRGENT